MIKNDWVQYSFNWITGAELGIGGEVQSMVWAEGAERV
jgi:hypothetical protein